MLGCEMGLPLEFLDQFRVARENPASSGDYHVGVVLDVAYPVGAPALGGDHDEAIRSALAGEQDFAWKAGLATACGEQHPSGCSFEVAPKNADESFLWMTQRTGDEVQTGCERF